MCMNLTLKKGASSGHKGASGGVFGIAGAKKGGIQRGTKLQAGTNFTQNVAIWEHWNH